MGQSMKKRTTLTSLITLAVSASLVFGTVGCQPASPATQSPQNQQPLEVVSVIDTETLVEGEINPGGSTIKVTLKNVSSEPIISLNVTMDEGGPVNWVLNFDVTPSNPLRPGKSISSEQRLMGAGFSGGPPYGNGNVPYMLILQGTKQNNEAFSDEWKPPSEKQ